jgi:hypothetical protein
MAILSYEMRRVALICLCLAALAAPAAALAVHASSGDGTLVVQRGSAPAGVPAVTLVIRGTVLGHVFSGSPEVYDKVVIYDLTGTGDFNATPVAGSQVSTRTSVPTTTYIGSDFRFRAVSDDALRITIYGSGVNLFAIGQGRVTLQGMPDPNASDGKYSLNGAPLKSLPAAPTPWLQITVPATG